MRILIFSNDSDSNYEDHCANNYPDEFSEEDDGVSSIEEESDDYDDEEEDIFFQNAKFELEENLHGSGFDTWNVKSSII